MAEEVGGGVMADPCVIILKVSGSGALTQLRAPEEYEAEQWLAALRGLDLPPRPASADAGASARGVGAGRRGAGESPEDSRGGSWGSEQCGSH